MSGQGLGPSPGQPPRLVVVVPTTGGPLLLRRLAPRPGLPHPAAFADGHYRPLALSPDYRALAGPEGPVARHLGAPLPPHELRLSGEPDGGRSWEAPVTLAHLLLAAGSTLVTDDGEADLLLWATGAVDLDLRLLPGDYALARKVESCRALLEAQGGRRTVAVLPPGPGREEAAAALATLRRVVPVEVILADTASEALARIASGPGPTTALGSAAQARLPLRGVWVATAAAAAWLLSALFNGPEGSVGTGLATSVEGLRNPGERDDPFRADLVDGSGLESPTSEDRPVPPADPEPMDSPTVVPASDAGPSAREPQPPVATVGAPPALIEEVRAAPGTSCRAALFDLALRSLRPVPRDGAGYAALTLDPSVCGVALRPVLAGASLGTVTAVPPGAFVAAPSGDGTLVLFLSGAPRDVVYSVPVVLGDGPPATVEHRLVTSPAVPAAQPDTSTE